MAGADEANQIQIIMIINYIGNRLDNTVVYLQNGEGLRGVSRPKTLLERSGGEVANSSQFTGALLLDLYGNHFAIQQDPSI